MDDIRAKFLWNLGIRRDNYPQTFLDTIQDIRKMVTNVELGYCDVSSRCDGQPGTFCIRDVVGTNHSRYAGKTWIDAFLDLDRGTDIIKLYEDNPGYWEEIKKEGNSDLGLIKYDGKYYIFDKAGGGNNRLITMRIIYLALISQAGNNPDEIERINKQFTFSANIRELPKDYTIPFITMAMGEYLSGLRVRKNGEQFTVVKKFTDEELFQGNRTGLIDFFKDLFRTDIYGEDTVKARLEELKMGCNISPPQFRNLLESLLPQFKTFNGLEER